MFLVVAVAVAHRRRRLALQRGAASWAASQPQDFSEHVAEFARKVMQDGTMQVTTAADYATASGTVKP